ncbi:hypothetical protein Celaphus_00013087, partial [Cervus elaphus hippelaphus]
GSNSTPRAGSADPGEDVVRKKPPATAEESGRKCQHVLAELEVALGHLEAIFLADAFSELQRCCSWAPWPEHRATVTVEIGLAPRSATECPAG